MSKLLRSLVPILLILAAIISLGGLTFPSVPTYTTSTYAYTSVGLLTEEVWTTLISWSNICVSFPGLSYCLPAAHASTSAFTIYHTTSATFQTPITFTNYVSFAASGSVGVGAVIAALAILLVAIGFLVRARRHKAAAKLVTPGEEDEAKA